MNQSPAKSLNPAISASPTMVYISSISGWDWRLCGLRFSRLKWRVLVEFYNSQPLDQVNR